MSPLEFDYQLQRMNEAFKNFYTKSRAKMISNIVADLPASYFDKCVDRILWQKDAPRVEWFHEIVSSFRKRQKVSAEIDNLRPQSNSIFDEPTLAMMKEYGRRRSEGTISDEDYENFINTIKDLIRSSGRVSCGICLDQEWYYPTIRHKTAEPCPQCEPKKDWPRSNGPLMG